MATDIGGEPVAPETAADAVSSILWYHTIELPGGIKTPGYFDTVALAPRVPLPERLDGKRCLDVGTADGFWAYQLERRGAAEVVAIDIDDTDDKDWVHGDLEIDALRGRKAFSVAKELLGSKVERRTLSVYDASPETLGTFDFVFIGCLLLHLRDPVGALRAAASVVDGELFLLDSISLEATVLNPFRPRAALVARDVPHPHWWVPNLAGLRRYVEAAELDIVASGGPLRLPYGEGFPRPTGRRGARQALRWAVMHRLGAPLGWVRARSRNPS